jgi:asparagine synthase (glutamine-hydrolysing)
MCGIVGCWSFKSRVTNIAQELSQATILLHHRGPDDTGLWFDNEKTIGLGHTRLSIIDLSEKAGQPMMSSDGRYIIVFNGEVYNYREIRTKLESKGYDIKSESDTEVVLYAFIEWGKKCVEQFLGMYAFAVWDTKKKVLNLCRDRVGVKPLYYYWDENGFCFGSELRVINKLKKGRLLIDKQALGEYFQYGYIAAPRSIFKNVQKLEPGHWLEIISSAKPKLEQYWSIDDLVERGYKKGSEVELAEQLEELLIDACKLRMIADVPVGVFLSGGVDSSIVSAILQKHHSQEINTFTIGFKHSNHDESVWAKKVAEHLGTKHTEYILDIEVVKDIIPGLAQIHDEPFGDSSAIPTYMVSKLARQEVKVALSADGGDELFGGYSNYSVMPRLARKLNSIPFALRRVISKGVNLTPKSVATHSLNLLNKFDLLNPDFAIKGLDRFEKLKYVLPEATECDIYDAGISHWLPTELPQLLDGYQNPRINAKEYNGHFPEQMMLWDFHHYLPDNVLVKVDRATMAVGLEGREPLLDHRLIEFAFRLPLSMRQGSLGGKHLLKKVLYKYVPQNLLDRPKQGFTIPIEDWLRKDLSHLLDTYLDQDRVKKADLLDYKTVDSYVTDFKNGSPISGAKIWLLLVFAMWYENYLE